MDVNAPIALIGAGYRDRDGAVDDFASVWSTRHDGDFHHTAVAVLTGDPAGALHVDRHNSTAKHLEWGGALLGSALVVLAPAAGVELLAGVGWSGAGAMIGHFRQHTDPEELARISGLLHGAGAALVVVVVNRSAGDVTPRLTRAHERGSVDLTWGDLEEELSADFAHPRSNRILVGI
jgi:hypothetical protein